MSIRALLSILKPFSLGCHDQKRSWQKAELFRAGPSSEHRTGIEFLGGKIIVGSEMIGTGSVGESEGESNVLCSPRGLQFVSDVAIDNLVA
jgi:hypothetical protein